MLRTARLDILDIATRPDSHLALVQAAVAAGIPLIVQKPLAPDLATAREIQRVVSESRTRAMVHENWRWQPWYRQAKQLIADGAIGAPHGYRFVVRQGDGLGPSPYLRQPYFREMPRLLIFETLVHHIDTARFLFGELEAVFATTQRRNPAIRGEDAAILILRHEGGVSGLVDANRYLDLDAPGPAMGEASFEGDAGRITINGAGQLFLGLHRVPQVFPAEGYKGDSVYATQQHFIDCLETGMPFETGIAEYLPAFIAADAAYRSADAGVWIALT